jgi:acyl dehydratase
MPVDASVVGRTYPATSPYEVCREKIGEFADAIGDPNPAYRGPGAVAPPTFAMVVGRGAMAHLLDDPELGLALQRVIHGDQRFSYVRPIRAGDEIVATGTITAVRQAAGMDVITLETALATTSGEPVGTSTATIFHRGES